MLDPVENFLSKFLACAADAASAKFGDPKALPKLFNGTAYSQRRKEWFVSDQIPLPKRMMGKADFEILMTCVMSAKKANKECVVGEKAIEELYLSYNAYLAAMRNLDGRRKPGLTARSISVSAAAARIDRLTGSYGGTIKDLSDKDCFTQIVNTEQERSWEVSMPHEAERIAHALCTLLINGKIITSNMKLASEYLMRAAALGSWASWQVGGDEVIRKKFLMHFDNMNRLQKNSFCYYFINIHDMWVNGKIVEECFDILDFDTDKPQLGWAMYSLYPGCFLHEVTLSALRVGIPLEQKCNLLRGRSPEEAWVEYIDITLTRGENAQAAWASNDLAQALAEVGRLDEAQVVLESVRAYATAREQRSQYLELRLSRI